MSQQVKGPTPGPWRVERQNPSPTTGEWMIAGGIPGYLAEVRDCGSGDVEANARLIAAAPAMLEALQSLEPYLDRLICYASTCSEYEPNNAVRKAMEAIAKATGESQ